MTYQRERDEFIAIASQEGLSLDVITKLLRYGSTLQRLAVAQCNGDWPADNGERKVEFCRVCESGFVASSFKRSSEWWEMIGGVIAHDPTGHDRTRKRAKVCPDCRTGELVKKTLPDGFKALIGGDPRGCVLKIQVPSGRTNDWGKEGVCVPARER